ncbi:MAG: hypothetical protein WBD99_00485, partial [Thermodesulfobacteriota bacterium]
MRRLTLTAFVVSLLSFTIGTIDANATGSFMFSDMAPCQQILLRPGNDWHPFITGYRCKGFAEGLPFQNQCVCYQAIAPDKFQSSVVTGYNTCGNSATCACDGFLDNFNTAQSDFLCDGNGFAYKGHLFFLWIPKIDVHGIFGGGDTANLVCFPDPT